MEEIDLKDCWKCGGYGIFVNKEGYPSLCKRLKRFKKTHWATCEYENCDVGIYTIKQWEDHERPTK